MKRKYWKIALAVLAVFVVWTAGPKQAAATTSLAYSSSETAIGGWDYAYTGDAASNGTGGTGEADGGKLDGTFNGSFRNNWDGSAPGEIGPAPAGDSPGGYAALTESSVSFLRMQDTWDPGSWSTNPSNNWDNGTDNGKLLLAHKTEQDVAGSASAPILSNSLTLTFRARIASTGTLDDIYQEAGGGTSAWPAGGRGPKISGSSTGLINIGQAGVNQIAFTLLKTADVLASAPGSGLTGGLYMNNQPGTPGGIGTSDLAGFPEKANFAPVGDADLLDWHEFWITIEREAGTLSTNFTTFTVTVYMDGSPTPAGTFAVNAGDDDGTSATSAISIGTGGDTALGAADIDFLAYNLSGAFAPVQIPEPATMGLMLLGGLAIVGLRRQGKK